MCTQLFETVGLKIAQLLVSQRDFLEQQRWAEIRDTIAACLEAGVVPITNENDTTNTDGMRFGDNDNLAALTAVQLGRLAFFCSPTWTTCTWPTPTWIHSQSL